MVGGRRVRTVDVHAHCYSLEVWALVKDRDESELMRNILNRQGQDFDLNGMDHRLSQMDALGIDVQALSVGPELHYWAEEELARRIVQVENEKIAAVCSTHPDRFVGIGGLALQHVNLALEQLEYGVRSLDLRGFMIGGSVNEDELSAPKFDPVWAKVEELGSAIFIHPRGFPDGERRFRGNGYLTNVIGNPLETTVALSHLIFDGVLDRFPRLKICGYHGGGFLPSYIGRSDFCAAHHANCKPVEKLPSEYIKQLYFDSLVFDGEGLRHLAAVAGASQVLLGTDYPTPMANNEGVNHILGAPGLSDAEREAMLGGNAARLLRIAS
jgi:aminocarboxymuconate-semialdehyde decarboxylase